MSKLFIFLVAFTYIGLMRRIIIHARGAIDSLKPGDQLNNSSRICSPNSTYCLSFRAMGDGNTYLATYNATDDSSAWIVWVANRDKPLTYDVADSAALTLDHSGALKVTCRGEEPIVLYTSSDKSKTQSTNNTEATLLDSGNFVLQQVNTDGSKSLLWQSFDYPTDTLFPGMKLGANHKTGRNFSLVSFFLISTPSSGAFSLDWEPKMGQLVIRRRGQLYWASGQLKNNTFENFPVESQHRIQYSIVSNEDEDSIMFTVKNNDNYYSPLWRLRSDGMLFDRLLRKRITGADECYGNNNDGGCQKWNVPTCRKVGETFTTMSIIVNDAEKITSNDTSVNSTTSDCQAACWSNCDCVGFNDLYNNQTGCYFVNGNSWQSIQNGKGTMFFMLSDRSSSPPKTSPVDLGNSFEGGRKANANSKKWKWIVPVIIITLFISIGSIFWLVIKRRKIIPEDSVQKERKRMEQAILHLEYSNGYEDAKENQDTLKHGHDLKLFSYASIMEATNGFSSTNKLGEGGFGPVYKGILMQKEVAVKRLSKSSRQGVAEFKTELRLVSELQHTNLIQLLGCCIHEEERLLIYEYMPNKSLDFFLFDSTRSKILDWKKRLNIIEGIAQGLLYLHKYSRLRIVHRDLKASNILLNEYMNPKISDFGMARIFMEDSEENTARIVGTFGYMPPEYAMGGVFSKKSDVYSFGVLLLEIVSGKRNNSFSNASNPINLVGHAWELWKEGQALQLIDPAIHDSVVQDQVLRCIHVGLLCVEERAVDRPTMSQVLSLLASSVEMLPLLKKPAFYFGGRINSVNDKSHKHKIDSINVVTISDFTAR